MIIVGWQTRLVALLLAIFCAVAAYFFHDFWHQPPGPQHTNNVIHFMKNVSMIGGFLMLCAAGAGRYSLDGPCIRPEYLRTCWLARLHRPPDPLGRSRHLDVFDAELGQRIDQRIRHGR